MIHLSQDFSVFPGGRTYSDGQFSAQEFYDKFLNNDENITIDLDGTRGIASCFLDELVKLIGWKKIGKTVHFISSRKSILDEIMSYKKKYEEYSKRISFKGICNTCAERYFCDQVKRNLNILDCNSYVFKKWNNNTEIIKEDLPIMEKMESVLEELKNLTDEEKQALAEDKRFDELIKRIDEELAKIKGGK